MNHIVGFLNVKPDGNCGFRVIASRVFGDQELWRLVRRAELSEINSQRLPIYQNTFYHLLEPNIRRITWEGKGCGPDHYMNTPDDLFPIATAYNAVIFMFGNVNPDTLDGCRYCTTIMPMSNPRAPAVTEPAIEICICHLDSYQHYIRLDLSDSCPIPPIHGLWRKHHDPSVDGWDRRYHSRIKKWRSMHPHVIDLDPIFMDLSEWLHSVDFIS